MHELGVVMDVVKTIENFALDNQLEEIETLVLQIGELSSMIPQYIEACYPAAVDGTILEKTKLVIEVLPGNGLCKSCEKVFNVRAHEGVCPNCKSRSFDLLGGKEFMIKEVIAR